MVFKQSVAKSRDDPPKPLLLFVCFMFTFRVFDFSVSFFLIVSGFILPYVGAGQASFFFSSCSRPSSLCRCRWASCLMSTWRTTRRRWRAKLRRKRSRSIRCVLGGYGALLVKGLGLRDSGV